MSKPFVVCTVDIVSWSQTKISNNINTIDLTMEPNQWNQTQFQKTRKEKHTQRIMKKKTRPNPKPINIRPKQSQSKSSENGTKFQMDYSIQFFFSCV